MKLEGRKRLGELAEAAMHHANTALCCGRAALLAAALVAGCGDDDDPVAPALGTGDVAGVIGSNHGHAVAITAALIDTQRAVTLILSRGDSHTHSVALSAAQVGEIGAGNQVRVTSSSDSGHSHPVTFN